MTEKSSNQRLLQKMLKLIEQNPGIRPKELHKHLKLEHSWPLRKKLIDQGLIRKERDGGAVRYFPTKKN